MSNDIVIRIEPRAQPATNEISRRPAPDLPAILEYFHREPDGYVSFHRRHRGVFRDVASISLRALRGEEHPWLPGFLQQLATDGFVSVNAFYRDGYRIRMRQMLKPIPLNHPEWGNIALDFPDARMTVRAPYVERTKPGSGGLRHAYRDAAGVRWLTSCWVDCDGWGVGLDAPATIAGIMRAYRTGAVPVPSFLLGSGRGAWAFWMIVDERNPTEGEGAVLLHHAWHRPDTPCRASRISMALHQQVNAALAARLQDLGADATAGDLSRVCRVPGSLNTTADAIVEVLPVLMDGAMRAYTLTDLSAALHLDTPAAVRRRATSKLSAAQLDQRAAAQQARDRKVFTALQALSDRRGGIADGCGRHYALFWLVQHGALAGLDARTIDDAAQRFAAACQPRLGRAELRAALTSGRMKARRILDQQTDTRRTRRPRYDTIADALHITADERIAIGLHTPPRAPAHTTATLDAAIGSLLVKLGVVPSQRDMTAHLQALRVTASQRTVGRTYQRLGVRSNRRAGRPKAPRLF